VKEKIIGISVYMVAFVLVTVMLVFLNGQYRNIFQFDFSHPIGEELLNTGAKLESLSKFKKNVETVVRNEYKDSLKVIKATTTFEANKSDSILLDSINVLKNTLARLEKQREVQQIEKVTNPDTTKHNVKYEQWLKNTTSLYEAMDASQAAKIITKYSDNVARDIIYSMKKKKAVQILASLKPDVVNRLIKVEE
jgi:flagellar motility protein MotE (MotC chaperone)